MVSKFIFALILFSVWLKSFFFIYIFFSKDALIRKASPCSEQHAFHQYVTSLHTNIKSLSQHAHPHVKLASIVARLYLEDVEDSRVTCGGLHLEDVCRHTAARRQVHVSVQNGERPVPAGGVLSWTHALTAEQRRCLQVWGKCLKCAKVHDEYKIIK